MKQRVTRRGFTLIEVMVSVTIMAIVAVLLVPLGTQRDQGRVTAAVRLLASDLEHAQMLALSRPDLHVALLIDADGTRWSIVDADHPGTPLMDQLDDTHAGRSLQTVLGEGRAAVSEDVLVRRLDGIALPEEGLELAFTSLGGLEVRAPQLQASMGEATATLLVDTDTGFASIVD